MFCDNFFGNDQLNSLAITAPPGVPDFEVFQAGKNATEIFDYSKL